MGEKGLLFVLCVFIAINLASTAILERNEQVPLHPSWTLLSEAKNEEVILRIAVKQTNLDILEETFWAVSNPKGPKYGQYLTKQQVDDLIRPSDVSINLITKWLSTNGLTFSMPAPDWIVVTCTAAQAKELLSTPFHVYKDRNSELTTVRSRGPYAVPDELAPHIDLIDGVTNFPKPMKVQYHGHHKNNNKRAVSGNPIIEYMLPGDTTLSAFFLPVCTNGNVTFNSTSPCFDQGNQITGITQYVYQVNTLSTFTTSINGLNPPPTGNPLLCKPCTDWTSRQLQFCKSAIAASNLSNQTVFCNSPVILNLRNYYYTNYSLQVTYETGQSEIVNYNAEPLYLGEFVTPSVLLRRYGVPDGKQILSNRANSQSVAEFDLQFYSPSDLEAFFDYTNVLPGPVEIITRNAPKYPGSEAQLDIEYIMGIAQNVTTVFWNEGITFLGWITNVLNSANPPLVHSVSYGGDEENFSRQFMDRCNTEFQKAGNRGLSILFASGDNGVLSGDTSHPPCTETQHFVPEYPSSSPYVTIIGATQFSTQLLPACSQTAIGVPITCDVTGEIGCSIETGARITSGGGFSDIYPAPSYQSAAVNYYLNNYLKDTIPSQYYNKSGRAYPDVSACGRNFLVFISSAWNPIDGTSASTPTFAGLITIANEERLNQNKPPLGFINPALYQDVFDSNGRLSRKYFANYHDILMGTNRCGELGQSCCPYGYFSSLGWDAVSGLGTPKNLVNYLVDL